jgi:hypothetical protein
MTMETTSNPPFASNMKRRQNHHRRRMAEAATTEPPPSRHRLPLPTAARRREPRSAKRSRCIEPSHMQRVNYCRPCAIGGRSLSPWIVFLPTCSPPLSTSAIEASAMAISAPRAAPRPFGASVVITTSDYPHSWPTPASDRGSCIGRHIEKLSKDQEVGGGKNFLQGISYCGQRLLLSWRKECQLIVRDLTFPQGTIAVRPSCLPNRRPRNRTSGLPELALEPTRPFSSFFIG